MSIHQVLYLLGCITFFGVAIGVAHIALKVIGRTNSRFSRVLFFTPILSSLVAAVAFAHVASPVAAAVFTAAMVILFVSFSLYLLAWRTTGSRPIR